MNFKSVELKRNHLPYTIDVVPLESVKGIEPQYANRSLFYRRPYINSI